MEPDDPNKPKRELQVFTFPTCWSPLLVPAECGKINTLSEEVRVSCNRALRENRIAFAIKTIPNTWRVSKEYRAFGGIGEVGVVCDYECLVNL